MKIFSKMTCAFVYIEADIGEFRVYSDGKIECWDTDSCRWVNWYGTDAHADTGMLRRSALEIM